ncbi:MAG: hypothetical protein LC744_03625 [Chloroflexi bacterium]|nr:hypothetical protein [Chloroflexota bacterium]
MRSPLGPVLVILGLAMTLVLVLVLFQTIGLRDDLGRLNERVAALGEEIAAQEPGIARGELQRTINDLESRLRAWMLENVADAVPAASPGGAGSAGPADADADEILDRLDEVLERLDALDERIDEICDGVPVC